jgi:negative regulator of sigma E activity
MRDEGANADERLTDFIDGELSDSEAAELEAELARDPELRAMLADLRHVRDTLATHGPVKARPVLFDKVMAAVENEPMPANNSWAWLRRPFGIPLEGLALVAAALLVVLIGLNLKGAAMMAPTDDAASPPADDLDNTAVPMPEPAKSDEAPKQAGTAADVPEQKTLPVDNITVPVPKKPTASPKPTSAPPSTSSYGSYGSSAPTTTPPPPAPPPVVSTTPGTPDASTAPPATTSTAPDSLDSVPALAPWGYLIKAWDDTILADLQRVAGKYGGRVVDIRGTPIRGGTVSPSGGTYYLQIPHDHVAEVDDMLRGLGAESTGRVDTRMYLADTVQMEVRILAFSQEQKTAPSSTYRK